MSLIDYTLEGKVNKVDVAIERIRSFDPLAMGLMDTPYYVAYSGGKDSDAIRILCELAGVRHDLMNNHTTVDAPETVRYVRSIVPPQNIVYPAKSMWRLIVDKGIPPTLKARYCCEVLKEGGGRDRVVMTGVRWAESAKRKANRSGVEVLTSNKAKTLILNADNDEHRRLFETCTLKGKRIVNPIIDWSTAEVWELLHYYSCQSNPLYQCGYHRVGCVGCPMSSRQKAELEERYPIYKDNYIRAFQRMVDKRGYNKPKSKWTSGEAVFDWWVHVNREVKQLEGQEALW